MLGKLEETDIVTNVYYNLLNLGHLPSTRKGKVGCFSTLSCGCRGLQEYKEPSETKDSPKVRDPPAAKDAA